jgi:hypothetical protein
MTLVTIANTLYPGPYLDGLSATTTLDAAGEYCCAVLQAREAMTISHVAWLTATVAGSPTVDVRIETVDATGFPSGTLYGTNTNLVTGALAGSTVQLHALTASASIARGAVFAVVVIYNSGTSVQVARPFADYSQAELPYGITNTGTPTKSPSPQMHLALGSSSTVFYKLDHVQPPPATSAEDFASATSPNTRGLRFQIPFNARVTGMYFTPASQDGTFDFNLYNDAGTELAGGSWDGDAQAESNSSTPPTFVYFDSPVTLNKDTNYRIAIVATEAGNNIRIHVVTYGSADYLTAVPWSALYTTFDGASWDDSATAKQAAMGLIIDQVDDGTGSGAAAATTAYTFA